MKYIGKIIDPNSAMDFCVLIQKKESKGEIPALQSYLGVESTNLSHLEAINLMRWEKMFDKNGMMARQYADDLQEMGLFVIQAHTTTLLSKALGQMQGNLFGSAIFKIGDKFVMPITKDFQFSPKPEIEYHNKSLKSVLDAFISWETIDENEVPQGYTGWADVGEKVIKQYQNIPTLKSLRFKGSAEWYLAKFITSFTNTIIKGDLIIVPKCVDFVRYNEPTTQIGFRRTYPHDGSGMVQGDLEYYGY